MYGIDQDSWNRILSVLRGEPKIQEIILFGSRAKGTFQEGSDIDICLKGEHLDYHDLICLKGMVDDLDLPWEIGLLVYDMIDEPKMLEHIARVGIKL